MSEPVNDLPDWFHEAEVGAARLEDTGDYEAAARVRFQARSALLTWRRVGFKDSEGKLILGERESTQLGELRGEEGRRR